MVIKNAVCMHEEDAGLLWKHVEYRLVPRGSSEYACCVTGTAAMLYSAVPFLRGVDLCPTQSVARVSGAHQLQELQGNVMSMLL